MNNLLNLPLLCIVFSLSNLFGFNNLPKNASFDSSTVLVSIKSNYEISSFNIKDFQGNIISVNQLFLNHKDFKLSRIYKIRLRKNAQYAKVIDKILKTQLFEYAEFSPVYRTFTVPNDVHANQWHLTKIKAQQAWNIANGNPSVKIAIVDDAVDYLHEDLKNKIFKNPNEIPNNNIDDDGNGYIDDVWGANAVYKKGGANPPHTNRSEFTHGTHCAGIAAASTNNGKGIASIGFGVSILPVSCADTTAPGYITAGYEGIVYAADMGADVISLSWGGSGFSATGQTVIDYANAKGSVVIAAAGNSNVNTRMYPAAYNNVISVAATDQNDKKAVFSNYGSWIDIAAPGVDIWSTVTGGVDKYDYMSGTSMACPLVAGLCALMRSQNKRISPVDIEKCLKNNADNINSLNIAYPNLLGAGRINAQKTLQCVKTLFADFEINKTMICKGQSIQFTNLSSNNITSYKWTISGANTATSNVKNPILVFNNIGKCHIKLVVSDGVNKDSSIVLNAFEIYEPVASLENLTSKVRVGDAVFLKIDFQGEAPWNIQLTDGVQTFIYPNITSNPFYTDIYPSKNAIYQILNASDKNCAATFSGMATITIDTSKKKQLSSCGNFELFSKTYDFGGNEVPHTVYALKDGNIAVVGITDRGGIGGDDIFLSKLKPDGSIIWTKFYGTTANENGVPVGIFDDKDNNLYIHGITGRSGVNSSYFIKLNDLGEVLFSRHTTGNSAPNQLIKGAETSTGSLYFVGTSGITGNQAGGISMLDKNGNRIWEKSFDRGGSSEHFVDFSESNGNFYAFGRTSNGAGGYGSFFTKHSSTGNIIYQKYLDFSHWDGILFGRATSYKTLMMVNWLSVSGNSTFGNQDIGIVSCDTNGNTIWSKVIGKSGLEEASGFLEFNKYFFVSGITQSFDGGKGKVFLIKFDINGNIIWSKKYGMNGESFERSNMSNMISILKNGQIILAARKTNNNKDAVLFFLDSCGNSNCNYEEISFNQSKTSVVISNSSLTNLGMRDFSVLNSIKIDNSSSKNSSSNICPPLAPKCQVQPNFSFTQTCLQDSVSFKQLSVDLSGKKIINHKWVFHDGTVLAGRPTAKFQYKNIGTFKVSLISFSDTPNQCSDTIIKLIEINNKLFGKINISRKTHCKGDTINPSFSSICGILPIKIQWSPVLFITQSNTFQPIIKLPNSAFVVATITDAQNNVFKDSVFVTVDQNCCKYESNIYSYKDNYCLGDTLNILNLKTPHNANSKWVVYNEDVAIDSMNSNELKDFKPNKAGLWTFKLFQTGNCLSNVSEKMVFIYPLPIANAGNDTTICELDTIEIGQKSIAQTTYNWLPIVGLSSSRIANPLASIKHSITYYLTVKDLQTQCENHDSVYFDLTKDSFKIGPDLFLCDGQTLDLSAGKLINGTSFLWSNGSKLPDIKIKKVGVYWAQKSNSCGFFRDSIEILRKECFCTLSMPNAFSPNANAINDYFPEKQIDTIINMQIFNRWGEMIFDNKATKLGWDGSHNNEIVQEGIYLYLIKYRDCFGIVRYLRGTFTLLR